MAHTACVFVVAGKIAAQDPFLIKKPPEKYRRMSGTRQIVSHEPSASGMPMKSQSAPAYIG